MKKGKSSRKKEQFWPMRSGGPYSEQDGDSSEIFKCVDCGAETSPDAGWNGSPDRHRCHPGCQCNQGDWRPGASPAYRRNFDRIFPAAPGAGL
jgi:hypothetical protein